MAHLAVYVTPRAATDEVVGWRGDELAVRVRALPDGGRANAAVCKLLAQRLGVSVSSVAIVRGGSSRHKLVAVDGVGAVALAETFGLPPE